VDPSGYTSTSMEQIYAVISFLLNSQFGGSWTPGHMIHYYTQNEAAHYVHVYKLHGGGGGGRTGLENAWIGGIGLWNNIKAWVNRNFLGRMSFGKDLIGLHKPDGETPTEDNNQYEPIEILIKHGVWNLDNQDWGKLDGHVYIVMDHLDYSFRPSNTRRGKPFEQRGSNYLLFSDGGVYSSSIIDIIRLRKDFVTSSFIINVTPDQKTNLLIAMQSSMDNPPAYSVFGTRCAGWAMSMLQEAGIVHPVSQFFQWSPLPLRFFFALKLKYFL